MELFLLKIDYWLFDIINQKGSFELGSSFFPWVTDLNQNLYFKIIAISFFLFFFIKNFKRAGITILLFLVLALSFSDFAGGRVKNHFLRLRPFENSEIYSTQRSPAGSKSFYSNHTSNMFTMAVYTGQFIPALKLPTFLIASLIGYSRIYNGVHYPSDVLAGGLAGSLWGFIFSLLAKKVLRLRKPQKDRP